MANTKKKQKVTPLRIILLAVLALVIALVVVIKVLPSEDKISGGVVRLDSGNRGCNLAAGGTVLEVGNSVFLCEPGSSQVMKVKSGETTGTPVGELRGRYLNSDGASLWYVDRSSDKLMKSDLNGAVPVEVLPGRVTMPALAGNYIYFIDVDSGYTLSRIAKDGSGGAEIIDANARVRQYCVLGELLYYCDLNNGGKTMMALLDGSSIYPVDSMQVGQVLFTQGMRMYFSNAQRDGALDYCELLSDGSYTAFAGSQAGTVDEAVANTETITCAAADDTHIYYVKAKDGCLYRRPLQGKNPQEIIEQQLTTIPVCSLQLTEDYVYCNSVSEGGIFCAYAKK